MLYYDEDEDNSSEYLTQSEWTTMALKEYAREYGRENPNKAWISTPLDTWEKNPHYHGPKVPHPEDDYPGDDDPISIQEWAKKESEEVEFFRELEKDYGNDSNGFENDDTVLILAGGFGKSIEGYDKLDNPF